LAANFVYKNTVKVLHYTSETKPWNFHFLHQREWRENYDGPLFGLWTRALRRMRAQLAAGDLWINDDWHNQGRVEAICDHRLRPTYGRRYPKTEQFAVIVSPSNNLEQLQKVLRIYASSNKVAQIFINGDVVKDEQGKQMVLSTNYLRSLRLRKPIKAVARGSFESINNKFNPIQGINTNAVYLADENVRQNNV
jgi:lipopolysaccharide biosynthesis glycosyltransferase